MLSMKGYIHGNTVIAQDEYLRRFDGSCVIVQVPEVDLEKPQTSSDIKTSLDEICVQGNYSWDGDPADYIRKARDEERI